MPAQGARSGKPRVHVRLQRLPDDELLHRANGVAHQRDVLILEVRPEQRTGDHGEGHLHEVGVDVDGAVTNLRVELLHGFGERILHDRGERIELFAVETLLNQTTLRAPGFAVGCQQPLAQEVPHPFHLDVGLLVVLRIGLQNVLHDRRAGRDDGLFKAAQVELKRFTVPLCVGGEDFNRIGDDGAGIREGAETGNCRDVDFRHRTSLTGTWLRIRAWESCRVLRKAPTTLRADALRCLSRPFPTA